MGRKMGSLDRVLPFRTITADFIPRCTIRCFIPKQMHIFSKEKRKPLNVLHYVLCIYIIYLLCIARIRNKMSSIMRLQKW